MTVALIDYGAGNLTSVVKGFRAVGADVRIVSALGDLDGATAIVCPGRRTLRRDASLTADGGPRSDVRRTRACRCSASASACSGCSTAATRPRASRDSACCPGRCFRLSGAGQGAARRLEHARFSKPGSRLLDGDRRGRLLAYFTHSYAAPLGPGHGRRHHARPAVCGCSRTGPRLSASSSIPRKSGATGLRMLENFITVVRGAR